MHSHFTYLTGTIVLLSVSSVTASAARAQGAIPRGLDLAPTADFRLPNAADGADARKRLVADFNRGLKRNLSRGLVRENRALEDWGRLVGELFIGTSARPPVLSYDGFQALSTLPMHGDSLPKQKVIDAIFVNLDAEGDAGVQAKIDSAYAYSTALRSRRAVAKTHFFPVRSRDDASAYWRQRSISTLNWGGVAGGLSGGSVYAELVSPLLHRFRVSVYGIIAAAEEDEDNADGANRGTLDRFLSGGGLINAGVDYPLVRFVDAAGLAYDLDLLVSPRFGLAIPILGGAASPDTSRIYDVGLELHGRSIDLIDGVGLFGMLRGGIAGGSRQFYAAMGLAEDRDAFSYWRGGVGLMVANQVVVMITAPLGGPEPLTDVGARISVTAYKRPAGIEVRPIAVP